MNRTNILRIEQIKLRDARTVKNQCFLYFFSKASEAFDARNARLRKHRKHRTDTRIYEQYI